MVKRSIAGTIPQTLKASLMLGLAGCVYGGYLTTLKIAANAGYTRDNLIVGQYLFALAVFGILVLFRYRGELVWGKHMLKILFIGVFGFGTNLCLYESVAAVNSSFSVTMLFQSIWIGIVFESLISRKLPPISRMIAAALVVLGMPLAAGFFAGGSSINPAGILWGFGAALSYVGMMWTSSHFGIKVHPVVRTFYFALAQVALASITSPQFYTSSILDPLAWQYAIPLGLFTGVIPMLLIMKYSPMVPIGVSTIMVGMELPSTIVLEIMILHQAHGLLNSIGVLMICLGIVVANQEGISEFLKQQKQEKSSACLQSVRDEHPQGFR